jgi:hypothetical protein
MDLTVRRMATHTVNYWLKIVLKQCEMSDIGDLEITGRCHTKPKKIGKCYRCQPH